MKTPRPSERLEALAARQRAKMARSAQTYVRGSTHHFYEWLDEAGSTLPDGPQVWICGDCHHGNLGPVANQKGEVAIQIRDLDQTVIGNPAHDIVRLAFSLASAARGFDLPGIATARMVEQIVEGYRQALRGGQAGAAPEIIGRLLKASRRRSWSELACERIHDPEPTIPLGKRFWPLSRNERRAIRELFEAPDVRDLATGLYSRPSDASISLLDAAFWVKGCSSLGRLRYAALISVEGARGPDFGIVDIKEAIRAAAPRAPDASMPRDNAQRVVEGARALAPFLGQRMRAARLLGKSVFLRELLPQDLKLDISRMDAEEAAQTARFLAGVVGRAHGRQMEPDVARKWDDELGGRRSKSLDAPSWLWRSVVELMAAHEAAYLDHCRRSASVAA
jgi:uncharacterized protein (DUF2252 family)